MTYIDRLNMFFRAMVYNPLPATAQLVYLHLLNVNNQMQWAKEFKLTNDQLSTFTGLSKDTITNAKRILKNSGWIDFMTDKKNPRKGSVYFMAEIPSNSQSKSQSKPSAKGQSNEQTNPLLIIPLNKVSKEEERERDVVTRTREPTAAVELSEEVQNAWFDVMAKKVDGYEYRKLLMWEREFGTKKLINSLYTARDHNKESRISFAFIQAILEGRKESGKSEFVSEYGDVI